MNHFVLFESDGCQLCKWVGASPKCDIIWVLWGVQLALSPFDCWSGCRNICRDNRKRPTLSPERATPYLRREENREI